MICFYLILTILLSSDTVLEDTIIRDFFEIPISRIAKEESFIRMAIKEGIVRDRPLILLKPEELKPVKFTRERERERLIHQDFLLEEEREVPSIIEVPERHKIEIRPTEELVRIEIEPELRDEELILGEEIEVLRMDVIRVLEKGKRDFTPLISTAISVGTVPVKISAIKALESEEPSIAIPMLKEALSDQAWKVRLEAAKGLARRGEEDGYREMRAALLIEEPEAKSEAARVLGEIGDVRSLPELRRYISHPNPDVRKQAIISLGILKDQASVLLIESALSDPDVEVRGSAARALGEIGDSTAIPALKRVMLSDECSVIRVFAAEAILRIEQK